MILACSPPGLGGCSAASWPIRVMTSRGAAVQDVQRLGGHPVFHRRVAGRVEAPGRLPQVFQHVDEVDHDDQVMPRAAAWAWIRLDLVVVAVDQGDPGPQVTGVAALGLVEDLCRWSRRGLR